MRMGGTRFIKINKERKRKFMQRNSLKLPFFLDKIHFKQQSNLMVKAQFVVLRRKASCYTQKQEEAHTT